MKSMAGALGVSRDKVGVFVVIPTELLNRLPTRERRAAFRLVRKLEGMVGDVFPGEYFQVIIRDHRGRFKEYPKDREQQLFPDKTITERR